jgi:hypothetical protein
MARQYIGLPADSAGNQMIEVADCRYLANQCLALADKPEISEGRRKALLEMATTWDRFAQEFLYDRWRGQRIIGAARAPVAVRVADARHPG